VPNRSPIASPRQSMPAKSAAPPIRQTAMPRRAIVRDTRPMFDGRPIHLVGSVRMLVTAYSPDRKSCGIHAHGITASGYSVWTNAMKLVAADALLLPFGALISVPQYNDSRPVPVLDRGGAIKGRHVDVLLPTDREARAWGKRYMTVTVWDYD
jgi:3D (Asp-Asp-Asp) domain-containing protein